MRLGFRSAPKSLHFGVQRHFLGLFGKKEAKVEEAPAPSTQLAAYRQATNQNRPQVATKAEEYFLEMRRQREQQDQAELQKQRDLEFQEGLARKEADVTLRTLDYRTIILANRALTPSGKFKDFEEFKQFTREATAGGFYLTEDNMERLLLGFRDFVDRGLTEVVSLPLFESFLGNLKTGLSYAEAPSFLVNAAEFLDLYCVEDRETWAALESGVLTKQSRLTPEQIVKITTHFSSQNEGSDILFEKLEVRLTPDLPKLSTQCLIDLIVAYFNRRVGTKVFVFDLLEELVKRMTPPNPPVAIADLRRLALALNELREDFSVLQFRLFTLTQQQVIDQKSTLEFTDSCLLARGFGFDHGSKELFLVLSDVPAKLLPEATLEQTLMFVEGFLLTYRITPAAFEVLDGKLTGFLSNLGLFDLVRIAKAYFLLGQEKRPLVQRIEHAVLFALYNQWEELDKETLFEIAHSYSVSRIGSRELYRVLELVLVRRLKDIGKDPELLRRFIALYEESGLCSAELLGKMRSLD